MEDKDLGRDKEKRGRLGAELLFWDEVGFSLQPSVRRTWAPIGQTPVIQCKASWKRMSAIGAVACSPAGAARELYFQMYEEAVNEDIIISYLKEMKEQLEKEGVLPGWVILIWDNLAAHRSNKVKEYLSSQSDWLIVEYLPAYAPELNPVEYVWSPLKGKDLANYCPKTLDELETKIIEGVDRIGDDKKLLQGCLHGSPLFSS